MNDKSVAWNDIFFRIIQHFLLAFSEILEINMTIYYLEVKFVLNASPTVTSKIKSRKSGQTERSDSRGQFIIFCIRIHERKFVSIN